MVSEPMPLRQRVIKDLRRFKVLKSANLDHVSKDEKQIFINQAADSILSRLTEKISQEIPEERKEEFEKLFNMENSEEEKIAFAYQYVTNFKYLYWKEIWDFRYDLLQLAQSDTALAKPSLDSSSHSSPRVRTKLRWKIPWPLVFLLFLILICIEGVLMVFLSPLIPVGVVVILLRRYRKPKS